jgi:hypothetical protein
MPISLPAADGREQLASVANELTSASAPQARRWRRRMACMSRGEVRRAWASSPDQNNDSGM